MFTRRLALLIPIAFGCLFPGVRRADAQGLIWSLPEPGQWVRFEGDYKETEFRPDAAEGDLEMQWDRHLTLKCLARAEGEFEGEKQPCLWIELVVVTGETDEGIIDPGPAGRRIYKVLVPESFTKTTTITAEGAVIDKHQIPVSRIPIVEGWRKIGDGQTLQIKSNVLEVYPVISLLENYETLKKTSDQPVDPETQLQGVTAKKYTGTIKRESPLNRSESQAELWLSDGVPFGVARWSVTVIREVKDRAQPRSAFKRAARFSVEMKAAEKGDDAQTELITPEAG